MVSVRTINKTLKIEIAKLKADLEEKDQTIAELEEQIKDIGCNYIR